MKAIIIIGSIILYILTGSIISAIMYKSKDIDRYEIEIIAVVALWPFVIYGKIILFLFLYIPKKIIELIIRKKIKK